MVATWRPTPEFATARGMTNLAPTRIGVIGAGEMGSNHCRVLANLKGAELVGVVDIDSDRAAQVASASGCKAFDSVGSLIPHIEAAAVAVPSAVHAKVAL